MAIRAPDGANNYLPSLSAMSFVSCSLDSLTLYLETSKDGLLFTTVATTNDEIIRQSA